MEIDRQGAPTLAYGTISTLLVKAEKLLGEDGEVSLTRAATYLENSNAKFGPSAIQKLPNLITFDIKGAMKDGDDHDSDDYVFAWIANVTHKNVMAEPTSVAFRYRTGARYLAKF